ncbi:hypothetical protein ElyMa_005837800 [Elysia marginata]|uniref:Uncharacterized protein n=1 Tax=Elysia marginata TaxID=1093978 RepID=A0AAV4FX69_9GAST|nr:hypothetical protein ElyMa_005837800 [Elysia marginata]
MLLPIVPKVSRWYTAIVRRRVTALVEAMPPGRQDLPVFLAGTSGLGNAARKTRPTVFLAGTSGLGNAASKTRPTCVPRRD